jgi:hypothetical protein
MGSVELSYLLRGVARAGGSITEKAVAPIAGIDPASEDIAGALGPLLAAINQAEDAARRPLLAAVVVGISGLPGAAFFASARELGLHAGRDDHAMWMRELRRVHAYWAHH